MAAIGGGRVGAKHRATLKWGGVGGKNRVHGPIN